MVNSARGGRPRAGDLALREEVSYTPSAMYGLGNGIHAVIT
jgi:hypothetical protein